MELEHECEVDVIAFVSASLLDPTNHPTTTMGDDDTNDEHRYGFVDPHSFEKGGNRAWYHDEGLLAGVFHTYDEFRAAPWHAPRKVHVFLPRDYDDQADTDPWPTLYAHDGSGAFFANGEGSRSLRLGELLGEVFAGSSHSSASSIRRRQPIVIAINPIDRDNEYTHERQVEDAGGSLHEYSQYVADGVVPWVRAHYHVSHDRRRTAVMGCSHGGLAAFYLAAHHPAVFGAALCFSASFWAGMDSGLSVELPFLHMRQSSLMAGAHATLCDWHHRPRFYIDWGTNHEGHIIHSHVEALSAKRGAEVADILVEDYGYLEGFELLVVVGEGHGHDEDAWHARLPRALVWLFADPPPTPTPEEREHTRRCIQETNERERYLREQSSVAADDVADDEDDDSAIAVAAGADRELDQEEQAQHHTIHNNEEPHELLLSSDHDDDEGDHDSDEAPEHSLTETEPSEIHSIHVAAAAGTATSS